MTVYYPHPADLSFLGGPEDGWILDSIFQEVDLDTGELIFEWRASDHIAVDSTMRSTLDSDDGKTPTSGFDYFHINSIDKDHTGNYIISARHTHQILCISPQGETIWILGGKHNMFTDLSAGRATDFTWQHHARWHAPNNTLSLFDNAQSTTGGLPYRGDHSRGLLLRLDTTAHTAQLVHDYSDLAHPKLTASQGSMQVLAAADATGEGGRVLVDYGFVPAWTEFAPGGDVLCDVRLAPWVLWPLGMVTSYRGFKTARWVGRPGSVPSTSLRPADGVLYVSWNGATEVVAWVLQGAEWEGLVREGGFEDLAVQRKDGFEAGLEVADDMPRYLRVAAVDRDGAVLGYSQVVDRYVGNAGGSWWPPRLLTVACVMLGVAVALLLVVRRVRRALLRRFPRAAAMAEVMSEWKRRSLEWTGISVWDASRRPEYRELPSWGDG